MQIEIEDIAKEFGPTTALKPVSLSIPSGALVALLAAVKEELHAEADPEHRLGQLRDEVDELQRTQASHGVRRRAHARQDHSLGRTQLGGVGRQVRRGT